MFLLSEGGCSVVRILNSKYKENNICIYVGYNLLHCISMKTYVNRTQAVTKQGTRRYDVVFPKYKKGGLHS